MSLITEKTQLLQDQDATDQRISRVAEALNHLAVTLTSANTDFWSREPSRILGELNADVPRSLAIFQSNTATGIAVNAQLDIVAMAKFRVRAPVSMPPGYGFNPEQGFTFTPEPAPE